MLKRLLLAIALIAPTFALAQTTAPTQPAAKTAKALKPAPKAAAKAPAKATENPAAAAANAAAPRVLLKTSMGDITVELYPDKAPKSVENFLTYVKSGFYDGTIFHRVIANFMIQGGGFTNGDLQQPKRTRADATKSRDRRPGIADAEDRDGARPRWSSPHRRPQAGI